MVLSLPLRCSRFRRAFTLVEILIVVAIVGILVALTLPVLGRMKWSAADARCLSNLRNIQMANQMYANDNNGYYVPTTGWDAEGKIVPSWLVNPEFLRFMGLVKEAESSWTYYYMPFAKGYLCPATQMLHSAQAHLIGANYGMNIAFNSALGRGDWGQKGIAWVSKVTTFTHPGRTVAFADCQDWLLKRGNQNAAFQAYKVEEEGANGDGRLAYRHKGHANVVYYDGSVASFTKKDLQDPEILSRFTLE